MGKELIDELNSLTGEKFQLSDLAKANKQGARSTVFCVAEKYAIKTNGKDYDAEKKALECLQHSSFIPKVFGFNDKSKTIFMEWFNGQLLFDYIYSNQKIPKGFIDEYYKMKLQMYEKLCEDYDDKWTEIFWIDNKIKKVDYGQVDVSPNQKNLQDFYHTRISQTKKELEQLKAGDEQVWKQITDKFLHEAVERKIVDNYRTQLTT